jgi:hypothetical protein
MAKFTCSPLKVILIIMGEPNWLARPFLRKNVVLNDFCTVDITTSVVTESRIDLLCPRFAFGKVDRTVQIPYLLIPANPCTH